MSKKADTRIWLICELISEKMAPIPEGYKSDAMERWHVAEAVLKEIYGDKVESIGFIKKYSWLGISPDGLEKVEDRFEVWYEVKAPEPKATMRCWIENKVPDEYFWQCIHYFVVIDELKKLNFTIFNPDMRDEFFRIKTIVLTREELAPFIEEAKTAIAIFYNEWMAIEKKLILLKPI